jgi:hypothetical protein
VTAIAVSPPLTGLEVDDAIARAVVEHGGADQAAAALSLRGGAARLAAWAAGTAEGRRRLLQALQRSTPATPPASRSAPP